MTKAIEVVERYGGACLAQRRFQSRRAIPGIVIQRALNIDVGERAVAAGKIRIGFDRAPEIGLRLVEPRCGESP